LWAQGKADAAIHQERLWNELAKNYDVDVQCWSISGNDDRKENKDTFERICAQHSVVYSG
jgi:hypothetical protein